MVQERATLVCIQETKISIMCNSIANFGRDTASPAGLQVVIQEEIHAWCLAGYKHLRTLMAAT